MSEEVSSFSSESSRVYSPVPSLIKDNNIIYNIYIHDENEIFNLSGFDVKKRNASLRKIWKQIDPKGYQKNLVHMRNFVFEEYDIRTVLGYSLFVCLLCMPVEWFVNLIVYNLFFINMETILSFFFHPKKEKFNNYPTWKYVNENHKPENDDYSIYHLHVVPSKRYTNFTKEKCFESINLLMEACFYKNKAAIANIFFSNV